MIVPIIPTIVPAFLNAAGMARIPEPSDDFRRLANDLTSLEINYKDKGANDYNKNG